MNNILDVEVYKFLLFFSITKLTLLFSNLGFTNTPQLLLLISSIIHSLIIIYNSKCFYGCLCLVTEFFLGLLTLGVWSDLLINQKICTIISILPVLFIWIACGIVYFTYYLQNINFDREYNDSIKKNIMVKKTLLLKSNDCSICFNKIDENSKGYHICNNEHYFHQDCLNQWIKTKGLLVTCPNCRQIH